MWQGNGPHCPDFRPHSNGWVARVRDGGSTCTWAPGKLKPRRALEHISGTLPVRMKTSWGRWRALFKVTHCSDKHTNQQFQFFFFLFFNWRIIAFQNFVFCQISTWVSHRYIYIPSLLNLPPISLPAVYQPLLRCQALGTVKHVAFSNISSPLFEAWILLL